MNKQIKKILTLIIALIMAVSITVPAFAMISFIEMPDGSKITLDVEPSDEVSVVKEKIQDRTGIDADSFFLTFKGKVLSEDRFLADYWVLKESTLKLVYNHKAAQKHEAVEGTCTMPGTIEWYSCETEGCDAKLDADSNVLTSIEGEISPDNHLFDDGVITKTATAKEDGIILYTCTQCGETKTETYSAPAEKQPCENRISGVCNLYNRVIDIPVLNVIIGIIHSMVHYFH